MKPEDVTKLLKSENSWVASYGWTKSFLEIKSTSEDTEMTNDFQYYIHLVDKNTWRVDSCFSHGH